MVDSVGDPEEQFVRLDGLGEQNVLMVGDGDDVPDGFAGSVFGLAGGSVPLFAAGGAEVATGARVVKGQSDYSIWQRNNLWMLFNALALNGKSLTLIAL